VSIFYKTLSIILFRNVTVQKSGLLVTGFHPLKDGFGLLGERRNQTSFISLIFLDLHQPDLQKLHTVEYPSDHINMFVDTADSTTFLLNGLNDNDMLTRICKIVDNTIIIGNVAETNFFPDCFYHGCVYYLELNREDNEYRTEVGCLVIYLVNV
jgi:hypothetical protein